MMTKKDFIALADTLRDVGADRMGTEGAILIDGLCHFMKGNNPNFNEARWRDYLAGRCGPNGGTVKEGK